MPYIYDNIYINITTKLLIMRELLCFKPKNNQLHKTQYRFSIKFSSILFLLFLSFNSFSQTCVNNGDETPLTAALPNAPSCSYTTVANSIGIGDGSRRIYTGFTAGEMVQLRVNGSGITCGEGRWMNGANTPIGTYFAISTTGNTNVTVPAGASRLEIRGSGGTWTSGTSATLRYRLRLPGTTNVAGGGAVCPDPGATLTATGGGSGTIYWQGTTSNGTSTANPSTSEVVTSAGTYYFRAQHNVTGCWGTQGSAVVTLNPAPTADAGLGTTICSGNSTMLNGSSTGPVINGPDSFSGSGGTSIDGSYGSGTDININVSGIPVGATITSTTVSISYATVGSSWRSELRVRATPPVAVGGAQNDIQPSTVGSSGTVTNAPLGTWGTGNPNGNWNFTFRESYNDGGTDANITNITITVNYTYAPPLVLSWSGGPIVSGETTLTPTVNPTVNPTVYTLSATSAGCTTTDNVTVNVDTPSTAPTSVSGGGAKCWGNDITLNSVGGTNGTGAVHVWYKDGCNNAFTQTWTNGTPYGTGSTTVNSSSGGILNVTSTSNDPMIFMGGLGSFDPAIYRYVNLRYRVTGGTAGNTEIFFYNGVHNFAVGGESVAGALISDGAWHVLSIDMYNDPDYLTGGNILGWRYDWATANGVTMELDFIQLSEFKMIDEDNTTTTLEWTSVHPDYPTAGTTTYASAKIDACGSTSCSSTTVTLPSQAGPLSNNNESATCAVSDNNWVHFYHSSGRLIASINSAGQNLGNVTVTSYVDGANALIDACDAPGNAGYQTSVMQRHWVVTPQFQPGGNVQVRLPFTNGELTSLGTASNANGNPNDNVAGIGSVVLTKYTGPSEDNNYPNNCPFLIATTGVATNHGQTANGLVTSYNAAIGSASYIDYTIPSFSELWLNGNSSSPLPVELTSFNANCTEDGKVELKWATASEHNSSHFVVEKSTDATTWSDLSTLNAAGNSSAANFYSTLDENNRGTNYYRLIQVDFDGTTKIYNQVVSKCKTEGSGFSLFPNPAKTMVTLEFLQKLENEDSYVDFYDVNGKLVKRVNLQLENGNIEYVDVQDLMPGYYIVRLFDGKNENQPIRFVKQ